MLCNIFFHMAVMVVENSPPSRFLKQKHRSAKSDVLKVLFPDTGKITNPTTQMFPPVFVLWILMSFQMSKEQLFYNRTPPKWLHLFILLKIKLNSHFAILLMASRPNNFFFFSSVCLFSWLAKALPSHEMI